MQTLQFKKSHTIGTSAAVDPYEETEADVVDDIKIQEWVRHVERVLRESASPFVAAEVLLRQMDERATALRSPDKLYLATVLPVLQQCVALLAPEYREVVSAAIHELIPAIMFTRAPLLAPSSAPVAPGAVRRVSYAECFLRIYELFLTHRDQLERHRRRGRVERRVMGRVVEQMDRLWLKMTFHAWRVYCRRVRERQEALRRVADRGMVVYVLPTYIRAWRQYAHVKMQAVKVAQGNQLAEELEGLYPVEAEAKDRHGRALADMKEKMWQLENTNKTCAEARQRLQTLRGLHVEVQHAWWSHWLAWMECVRLLFGDTHPLPGPMDDNINASGVEYAKNVTDSAALYERRARAKTARVTVGHIERFLAFEKDLVPLLDPSRFGDKRLIVNVSPSPAALDTVLSALARVCCPVVSPASAVDAQQENQCKMRMVLDFMTTLYGGGHCSLFSATSGFSGPASAKRSIAARAPSLSTGRLHAKAEGEGAGQVGDSGLSPRHEAMLAEIEAMKASTREPPKRSGTIMVEQVTRGIDRLHLAPENSERYMLSLRRCVQASEMDGIHDYLGAVFQRLRVLGLPLERAKLEAATFTTVAPSERPVVQALYPAAGVASFGDLVDYLTKVSEFSGSSLLTVAERVDTHFDLDGGDEARLALSSPAVVSFFGENGDHTKRLAEWLKDPDTLRTSRRQAEQLLAEGLGLSDTDAQQVWDLSVNDAGTIAADALDAFLYNAACFVVPSPFMAPEDKLARTLDATMRYLLGI